MTTLEVASSFFDSYRAAFERFDAEAVADHFAFPCHVAGDADGIDVRCVHDRKEWLETITMLLDLYQGFGVATAAILEQKVVSVSERVVQAAMHWSLRDTADGEIYDFHGLYTLVRDGDVWRIVAIAHDELPKIAARLSLGS